MERRYRAGNLQVDAVFASSRYLAYGDHAPVAVAKAQQYVGMVFGIDRHILIVFRGQHLAGVGFYRFEWLLAEFVYSVEIGHY
jgi:hypothetical protein